MRNERGKTKEKTKVKVSHGEIQKERVRKRKTLIFLVIYFVTSGAHVIVLATV